LDLPELASPWSIGFSPLGFAYIPGNLSDNLAVYDPVEGLLGTAYLYADSTPTNVAFAAGKAYVADTAFDLDTLTYGIGKVSVIDLSSHLVLKNIETTAINPNSILAAPSGKVYVACPDYEDLTGVIDIIDSETDQIVDSIDMGIAPGPLALAPNGKLFVGEGWAGQFYVIDTADDSVLRGNADPVDACESFWTHDLAVDDDGTLYVVDFVNQTICTFSSEDYASAGDFPVTGVSAQKIVVW